MCPTPAPQIVFQEYLRAVTEEHERLGRLEYELQEAVKGSRLTPGVEAIQALRGRGPPRHHHRDRRTGGPHAVRDPAAAAEFPRPHALGVVVGDAAAAGRYLPLRLETLPAEA